MDLELCRMRGFVKDWELVEYAGLAGSRSRRTLVTHVIGVEAIDTEHQETRC